MQYYECYYQRQFIALSVDTRTHSIGLIVFELGTIVSIDWQNYVFLISPNGSYDA